MIKSIMNIFKSSLIIYIFKDYSLINEKNMINLLSSILINNIRKNRRSHYYIILFEF